MPSSLDTALKLWVVLNRTVGAIEKQLRPQVEAHGLSFTEFAVLEALLHKGRLPIGELGSVVLLTSGSMTYVVDKLEKRGLLIREACPEDRRVTYARLTLQGQALIERVFAEHSVLIDTITGGLSREEQQAATEQLKRLGKYAAEFAPPG